MLVLFHFMGIIFFQILKYRKRLLEAKRPQTYEAADELDTENRLCFDPPVYKQRYSKVYETLLNETWKNNLKKLVDFGCAEFGLFVYLKNLYFKEILFVDIDEHLLWETFGKLEPLLIDRLKRRNCPLEVSVFRGSVSDPDYRLRNTDAVTAIELVEHLYPDTLEAFPYNIFSFIRPKLVIITTPNADFNVMFEQRHCFRHPDHKFEWTREQFEDWASNITRRFPDYAVNFCGIGEGPDNTKSIGCCSQAAIFVRKDVLYEKYISPAYIRSCKCDKSSPCKGDTTDCKLTCSCLCALCVPDFSVGICTHSSLSLKDSEGPQLAFSDTQLNNKSPCNQRAFAISPSYNIFYKLIDKIDYPYQIDTRSEIEKLLQTFQYRIVTFSHTKSRFYVEETHVCEIPVKHIMYGNIEMSLEEVRCLLSENGYRIEICTIPETNESEYCIISMPQDMDEITSSSEITDEDSSQSSEYGHRSKYEASIEHLSDWDEIADVPKEQKSPFEKGTP